ncbi:hypothetical protein LQ327_11420 [Actinomycetospora endophytica]|uniref:Phosphodiester glycosidase domain-containing protein n=1 Tax=Actinomycetospora endophytica TaxID=2291215 RepID=A0ABS8P780_9PSEU|nr:hypothetical protein [Actinomycetospora endophytica]MCD2193984.1 hypothetical protein [Actinomycetospora endophytica]
MAPHPSSGLAAPDTGPTERVDVSHDDRPAADEDALDVPTVATAAVRDPEDEAPEDQADPTDAGRPEPETTALPVDDGTGETEPADDEHDDGSAHSATETDSATESDDDEEPDDGSADTGTVPVAPTEALPAPEQAEPTTALPTPDEPQPTEGLPAPGETGAGAGPEAEPGTAAETGDESMDAGTVPVAAVAAPVGATTAPTGTVETDPTGTDDGADPGDGTSETDAADDDTTAIPVPEKPRRRSHLIPHTRWLRRSLAALAVVVVLLAAISAPSLIHALTRPGSDTVAARLAEWGRDHGFGPMVTWLEARQYDLDQPATGGTPAGGIPHANGAVADHPGGSPAPPPLSPPAGLAPLPGEGQWQPVVSTPHGDAVRLTTVRPDAAHTSFLVGVLWMDPTLVRGVLHPGTEDPGGTWPVPTSVDSNEQRTVVDAFSAGFRLQGDSHGGWYLDGKEARPLVPGAASLVINKNGTTDVGAWGTEVKMSSNVAAVRQNLIPLVDHGTVNPTCATGGTAEWGSTVGQAAYINRSAFGVTATGAEIYVGGPALSVCTLGDILRSAGAVRGMELDINPAWVSGAYFHPTGQPRPDAFQLFPGEQVGAQHYLQTSSRDFVSFDLRSLADAVGTGNTPATSQQHKGGKRSSGSKQHP